MAMVNTTATVTTPGVGTVETVPLGTHWLSLYGVTDDNDVVIKAACRVSELGEYINANHVPDPVIPDIPGNTEIDARINALTSPFALVSNNDAIIGDEHLPLTAKRSSDAIGQIARNQVWSWAVGTSNEAIPIAKFANMPEWTRNEATQIPGGKLRNALFSFPSLKNWLPFINQAIAFFRKWTSVNNTETYTVHAPDGVTKWFSHWGDDTDFSPDNLDGVIVSQGVNHVVGSNKITITGFNDTDFLKGRFERDCGTAARTHIILGLADDLGVETPFLRIRHDGSVCHLEYNLSGSRGDNNTPAQDWDPVTDAEDGAITFPSGSLVNIDFEAVRQVSHFEMVIGTRYDVAGSDPVYTSDNNIYPSHRGLHLSHPTAEIQSGHKTEFWESPSYDHHSDLRVLELSIARRFLGRIDVETHSATRDVYLGDLQVTGRIFVTDPDTGTTRELTGATTTMQGGGSTTTSLTLVDVDGRIAPWARTGSMDDVPDANLGGVHEWALESADDTNAPAIGDSIFANLPAWLRLDATGIPWAKITTAIQQNLKRYTWDNETKIAANDIAPGVIPESTGGGWFGAFTNLADFQAGVAGKTITAGQTIYYDGALYEALATVPFADPYDGTGPVGNVAFAVRAIPTNPFFRGVWVSGGTRNTNELYISPTNHQFYQYVGANQLQGDNNDPGTLMYANGLNTGHESGVSAGEWREISRDEAMAGTGGVHQGSYSLVGLRNNVSFKRRDVFVYRENTARPLLVRADVDQTTDGTTAAPVEELNGTSGNFTTIGFLWAGGGSGTVTSFSIPDWNRTTTYADGNAVIYLDQLYVSLQNANTGNLPSQAGDTAWWNLVSEAPAEFENEIRVNADTTYTTGQLDAYDAIRNSGALAITVRVTLGHSRVFLLSSPNPASSMTFINVRSVVNNSVVPNTITVAGGEALIVHAEPNGRTTVIGQRSTATAQKELYQFTADTDYADGAYVIQGGNLYLNESGDTINQAAFDASAWTLAISGAGAIATRYVARNETTPTAAVITFPTDWANYQELHVLFNNGNDYGNRIISVNAIEAFLAASLSTHFRLAGGSDLTITGSVGAALNINQTGNTGIYFAALVNKTRTPLATG